MPEMENRWFQFTLVRLSLHQVLRLWQRLLSFNLAYHLVFMRSFILDSFISVRYHSQERYVWLGPYLWRLLSRTLLLLRALGQWYLTTPSLISSQLVTSTVSPVKKEYNDRYYKGKVVLAVWSLLIAKFQENEKTVYCTFIYFFLYLYNLGFTKQKNLS